MGVKGEGNQQTYSKEGLTSKQCIRIAKQLCYDQKFIDELEQTKDTDKCANIMARARLAKDW